MGEAGYRAMIKRFNRRQVLKAGLAFFLSLLSLSLAFLFFWYALGAISRSFDLDLPASIVIVGASVIVLLILTGCLISYSRGNGHAGVGESDLPLEVLDSSTGGSRFVGHYARRVIGPAYLLSQLYDLCGGNGRVHFEPLLLLIRPGMRAARRL